MEQELRNARAPRVRLRAVQESDLASFFEHQLDPAANHMAAFTAEDPTDREAFTAVWTRILNDAAIAKKTILLDEDIAGNIVSFEQYGRPSVGYWIARKYWGRGVATEALAAFLRQVTRRPLFARAAKDNLASLRVLKKCGFTVYGEDEGFAYARGEEVEEFILELRDDVSADAAAQARQPRTQ